MKSTIFYATKLLFLLLVKHNTIFYHLFNGISHFLEFSFRVNMRLKFRYLKGSLNSIICVFSLFSFLAIFSIFPISTFLENWNYYIQQVLINSSIAFIKFSKSLIRVCNISNTNSSSTAAYS